MCQKSDGGDECDVEDEEDEEDKRLKMDGWMRRMDG